MTHFKNYNEPTRKQLQIKKRLLGNNKNDQFNKICKRIQLSIYHIFFFNNVLKL